MNDKIIQPRGTLGNPDEFDIPNKIMQNQNAKMLAGIAQHKAKISRVVLEVEAILIKEDFKWNDWNEVVDKFNDRNAYIMPRMTIKEIKERHDKFTSN